MNVFVNLFSFCLLFWVTNSKPLGDLLRESDSELVGSSVSKIVAPSPFEDLQAAGTHQEGSQHNGGGNHHDDDDSGYYKSKSTKGDDGYKHFDSFHKKGGDKYGYETHSAFGYGKGKKDGGSHHTSGKYSESDGDEGGSHGEYHDGEGTEVRYGKVRPKDHKTAATDGDYFYSHYENDGEAQQDDDSGHFSDEGDDGHYEDDGGHYSEGYEEEAPSSSYYEGESEGDGDSGAYYDEGETRNKKVIHHGPSGATSYFVRHD